MWQISGIAMYRRSGIENIIIVTPRRAEYLRFCQMILDEFNGILNSDGVDFVLLRDDPQCPRFGLPWNC